MGTFVEILKRKYGPAPLWVYLTIGILALAWYLRNKQKKAPSKDDATDAANDSVLQDFALAYPMPYSGNYTVGVPATEPATAKDPFDVPPSPLNVAPTMTGPLDGKTSLTDLAKLYWNHPEYANRIYLYNRDTIETAAKKAGYASSQNGAILVPGVNLLVPPINYQ